MNDFAEYHVVLLVEQALSQGDAEQVRSLHTGLDQPVTYHVLLPLEDAAARIEASMTSLASGDLATVPGATLSPEDLQEVRQECERQSGDDLASTLATLAAAGATAQGEVVDDDSPVEALAAAVERYAAQEAIILTRPHVVSEFFHLDWTSKARRQLGVPVLHLLERENFDEQAGGTGEGITGL